METYLSSLSSAISKVKEILLKKGIEERYLEFGAEEQLNKKIFYPTDANSEFLANRAMGDWAENLVINQINQDNNFSAIRYGDEGKIQAGEPDFKEYYKNLKIEVSKFGKRPDILIFNKLFDKNANLSSLNIEEAKKYVSESLTSIEVRSSKFESEIYSKVRKSDSENKKFAGKTSLGFTVKVEDLNKVYRWILVHSKPQSYMQVFFDKIYCINFLRILELISEISKEIKIEQPAKSQLKTTIFIPVTFGVEVGQFIEKPKYEASEKITRLGRHDVYVNPIGGKIKIDYKKLEKTIFI
jgi:hypothetical protein